MLENDDDFELLCSQLEDLPNEVEDLYVRMLDRIDHKHRSEAARYLRMTQTLQHMGWLQSSHFYTSEAWGAPLSIFDLCLSEYGLEANMQLKCLNLDPQMVVSKCQRVAERIKLTCAGLLEVRDGGRTSPEEIEKAYGKD